MDDRELARARWATFAALLICFSSYAYFSFDQHLLVAVTIGLVTASLLTAVLELWLRLSLRRAMGGERFAQTRRKLEDARQQVHSILDLQHKFLESHSEKEILEALLASGLLTLKADGASFAPYDEWGQSLPVLFQGKVPETALQSWASHMRSPQTRQACKNCVSLHGGPGCALIPLEPDVPASLRSFPLYGGEREVGVVHFFFDAETELELDARVFVVESLLAAGQALQNLRARDQEIAALRYLQTASAPKSELRVLLKSLLENVHKALDVDFALLYLPDGLPGDVDAAPLLLTESNNIHQAETSIATEGSVEVSAVPDLAFLEGVWKSVLSSGQSLSLENVSLKKREMWKALLAVPLIWQAESPAGVLVLGSHSNQSFAQRQALLETLASQAALLIQNASLMAQVEYQAVVDERTRLAREIHDGLAQTLAFLKIQAAQMQTYLADGELDRLTNTLQSNYRTLSDAYLDARQAIDNLRRMPSASLQGWIRDVADDFEQSAALKVDLSKFELKIAYPPTVQVQLIRIVQEALNNVRKHAKAHMVEIVGRQDGDEVLIQVRDDGLGFSPELVDASLRYGLRGMQERAEMIGADFQIISQPGRGSTVSLRLLAPVKEDLMSRILLVVVDDHALFRRGLISLLSEMPDFQVAGEATNGREALKVIEKTQPDIVLLDINMPVMNGIETLNEIRKMNPAPKVLMLTISQNDEDLIGAIVSGAKGYVLKNTEPEALRNTILQVMAGNSVLAPEMTDRVFQAVRRSQSDRSRGLLSDREVEVLGCLARGQTTAQIAGALFISENTVKTHIRHILEKMEVNNRAEAVARAAQMDLI